MKFIDNGISCLTRELWLCFFPLLGISCVEIYYYTTLAICCRRSCVRINCLIRCALDLYVVVVYQAIVVTLEGVDPRSLNIRLHHITALNIGCCR